MDIKHHLELAEMKIERQREQLQQMARLLEYYREFAPTYSEALTPPTLYWLQEYDNGWTFGWVVSGSLETLDHSYNSREEAVKAAWKHSKQRLEGKSK
ncbi:hypothetical protein GCM10007160_18500 [Litchfieldella qijiaojingensis]|uniref:Uncharacterized protein n=1 Tax=Litchfieldella qijiaojingensis TaxID=980347 RepID=A0ABQ2YSN0_9GAMM|nr:hypothetical protein [Halomonas qijiaojingensis]GGX91301.1 hypothetical protein GCM10007160_18500 [Halomonas qijiaojingensis]